VNGGLANLQNVPIKALAIYAQGSNTGRFQHYNPDYFTEENPKMPLLDPGLVKEMKVAMFVGLWDNTCPVTTAQQTYEMLAARRPSATGSSTL
jgi:hypothetical protein